MVGCNGSTNIQFGCRGCFPNTNVSFDQHSIDRWFVLRHIIFTNHHRTVDFALVCILIFHVNTYHDPKVVVHLFYVNRNALVGLIFIRTTMSITTHTSITKRRSIRFQPIIVKRIPLLFQITNVFFPIHSYGCKSYYIIGGGVKQCGYSIVV